MWQKLMEFRNAILFVTLIISMTLGFTAYFAKASELYAMKQEFREYKAYQRLEYLDQRIGQFEDRYKCYHEECRAEMPITVWEEYRSKRVEKLRLEKRLLKDNDN